jgi:predicted XRE-type DNA-binding protein
MLTDDILNAAIAELRQSIQDRHISQSEAARLMGIAQPNLSRIFGKSTHASLAHVLELLCYLGVDIDIEARHNPEGVGHITFRGKANLTQVSPEKRGATGPSDLSH